MTTSTEFPNPRTRPTMPVPEGGHWLAGLGRSASYAAAERGELPTITIGRKRVVPTAALAQLLGITFSDDHAPAA